MKNKNNSNKTQSKKEQENTDQRLPAEIEESVLAESDEEEEGSLVSYFKEDTPPEIIALITSSFSGPLPPPAILERYEETLTGAADRVFTLAENEQNIRKDEGRHSLWNDSWRVWGSTIVSVALVGGAVYCAFIGAVWPAVVMGGSGAIATIMKTISK